MFPRCNFGTTPPYNLCRSICDEIMFERTFLPLWTTAAAVSSHELSIAKILMFSYLFHFTPSIFKHQLPQSCRHFPLLPRKNTAHLIHIILRFCQRRTVMRQPHLLYWLPWQCRRLIERHGACILLLLPLFLFSVHSFTNKQIRTGRIFDRVRRPGVCRTIKFYPFSRRPAQDQGYRLYPLSQSSCHFEAGSNTEAESLFFAL